MIIIKKSLDKKSFVSNSYIHLPRSRQHTDMSQNPWEEANAYFSGLSLDTQEKFQLYNIGFVLAAQDGSEAGQIGIEYKPVDLVNADFSLPEFSPGGLFKITSDAWADITGAYPNLSTWVQTVSSSDTATRQTIKPGDLVDLNNLDFDKAAVKAIVQRTRGGGSEQPNPNFDSKQPPGQTEESKSTDETPEEDNQDQLPDDDKDQPPEDEKEQGTPESNQEQAPMEEDQQEQSGTPKSLKKRTKSRPQTPATPPRAISQEELDEMKKSVEKYTKIIAGLQEDLRKSVDPDVHNRELDQMRKILNDQLDLTRKECEDKIKKNTDELAAIKKDLSVAKAELTKAQKEASSTPTMKTQITDLQARVVKLEDEKTVLSEKIKAEAKKASEELTELEKKHQAALKNKEEELRRSAEAKDAAEKKVAEDSKKLAASIKDATDLKTQITDLESKVKSATDALNQSKTEAQNIEVKRAELEKKLAAQMTLATSISTALSTAPSTGPPPTTITITQGGTNQTIDITVAGTMINQLIKDLETSTAQQTAELAAVNQKFNDEKKKLDDTISQAETKITTLGAQVASLTTENTDLKDQVTKLTQDIAALIDEKKDWDQREQDYKKQISDLTAEQKRIEAALLLATNEVDRKSVV